MNARPVPAVVAFHASFPCRPPAAPDFLGPEILDHLEVLVDADIEPVGLGSIRTMGDCTIRRQIIRGGRLP